ncbi:MAG: porin [Burkholderiaceae bacterium]
MSKTKCAAALFAGLLSPWAMAQSNVTMYGIADAGIGFIDVGGPGNSTAFRVDSGYNSTGRWGIRGSEDLGGGLQAFFKAEAEVGWDTGGGDGGGGNALNFARGSYVGLEGRFGQVWFGRDYVSGYPAMLEIDILRYGLFGNLLTFLSGYQGATVDGVTYGAVSGMQTRTSNGIFYKTPQFGGHVIQAHYGAGERYAAPKSGGSHAGVSWIFASGPWSASAWFHQRRSVLAPDSSLLKTKEYGGGGGYRFGPAKLVLGAGVSDPDGPQKLKFYNVGGSVRAGTGTVYLQFTRMKEDASSARGNSLSLSYTYPLSKRTNLYATAGTTRNNATGTYVLRGSGLSYAAGAPGADQKGLALGIRHFF